MDNVNSSSDWSIDVIFCLARTIKSFTGVSKYFYSLGVCAGVSSLFFAKSSEQYVECKSISQQFRH